jgi:hypothetical protein
MKPPAFTSFVARHVLAIKVRISRWYPSFTRRSKRVGLPFGTILPNILTYARMFAKAIASKNAFV